ncbi:hypothetical protein C7212DRAFT_348021 [Tuber magnatum]|uniref:Uncharacterized protein n=1 Tax=Tuber magnatum TaxID=42249 RepID=A0A317SCJ9_9PEZI|nr:hypothetical protein C7212DRAFT_348021 [Tuber magnatum]
MPAVHLAGSRGQGMSRGGITGNAIPKTHNSPSNNHMSNIVSGNFSLQNPTSKNDKKPEPYRITLAKFVGSPERRHGSEEASNPVNFSEGVDSSWEGLSNVYLKLPSPMGMEQVIGIGLSAAGIAVKQIALAVINTKSSWLTSQNPVHEEIQVLYGYPSLGVDG